MKTFIRYIGGMMVEIKLMENITEFADLVINEFPKLKGLDLTVGWDDLLHEKSPPWGGAFIAYEDNTYSINVNPNVVDFLTLWTDIFPHEIAHFVHYVYDQESHDRDVHGKEFDNYLKQVEAILLKQIYSNKP